MYEPIFTGVCTALVTPFLDGKVNYPMLEQLLRRQLDAGIRAVVIAGTTGESPTLSDEEKLTMFRRAKDYVGDEMTVIAGTGSNNTCHAVNLSKAAEQCGVDGLLVVSPYYNKATPSGVEAHYRAIASSVKLPVILYNVPSRTGVDIPVEVYQALAAVPNIVGTKEASTDIGKVLRTRARCPSKFQIWSGNDELAVPMISLGGAGVISVLSNILPEQMRYMTEAALDGDFDTAAALQCSLLPWAEFLFCEVNPIPVKAALKRFGFDCGACRLPLTELSAPHQKKLEAML